MALVSYASNGAWLARAILFFKIRPKEATKMGWDQDFDPRDVRLSIPPTRDKTRKQRVEKRKPRVRKGQKVTKEVPTGQNSHGGLRGSDEDMAGVLEW